MTFGEVLGLRSMGILSVLDFACTLEAAMNHLEARRESSEHGKTTHLPDTRTLSELLPVLLEPWADWISEKDPRFRDLLPPGAGTIAERIDELISNPEASLDRMDALAEALPGIRTGIAAIGAQQLGPALMEYLARISGIGGDRLRALAARLHWTGDSEAKTLEEAGVIAGVTRERVRQIQARYINRRPSHPVVMPALDRALAVLRAMAPVDARVAAEAMVKEGLSSQPFHPSSLIAAAVGCGRTPSVHVETVLGVARVVASPLGPTVGKILKIAQRQASACGASNIMELAAELEAEGVSLSEEEIRGLLSDYSEVEFLEAEWFWFPRRSRDTVRSLSRKMLSVTSPLDVGRLREGIKRAVRFRRSTARSRGLFLMVPPRSVLLAYYRAHPEFVVVDESLVKATRPLDYRVEIPGVEQVIVDVLRSAPDGVMDNENLAEGCTERGVNTNTLRTLTSYSPVLEHLGTGLWTLRGSRVDPAAVETIRQASALRPRESRVLDHGWAADGRLWIAIRIPARTEGRVFGVPSAVHRFLAGRDFDALTAEGAPCGRVRIYDYGASTGYSEFLRRAGADHGDILLALFNLVDSTVTLGLTNDDAIEELSPEV